MSKMTRTHHSFIHGYTLIFVMVLVGTIVAASSVWLSQQKTQLTSQASLGAKKRYIDPIFTEVTTTTNVTYSRIDGQELQLDIFEPKNDGLKQRPAIVWIHAGGFYTGKKEDIAGLAQAFAQRGYVSISINYRLGGDDLGSIKHPTPEQIRSIPAIMKALADAQTAIRWTRANADRYRIDPQKIVVGGGSAGGVTALLVAYNPELAPTNREHSAYAVDVLGTIAIMGVADPTMVSEHEPPVIMFNAGLDTLVLPKWVYAFQKRLVEKNIPHEFHWYPQAQHGKAPYADIIAKAALFTAKLIESDEDIDPPITLPPKPSLQPTIPGQKPTLSPSPRVKQPTSTPPPVLPTAKASGIHEYFQQHPKQVCQFMHTYFKTTETTLSQFDQAALQKIARFEPTIQILISQTKATAEDVRGAYLATCTKK